MARLATTPTLVTENNIHNWVGEAQYNRGMRYVLEGLIIAHSQSGRLVRGWCLPRDGQPGTYYVWAKMAGLRVREAYCTCPLGKYGICPHVAAVLVQYVRDPQSFQRSIWQRLFQWRGQPTRMVPVQHAIPEPVNQVA